MKACACLQAWGSAHSAGILLPEQAHSIGVGTSGPPADTLDEGSVTWVPLSADQG